MTPEVKLELARAAVEFAEASLDEVRGDGWSAYAGGGGGDLGMSEHSIPHELMKGKSVEEIKRLLDAGIAKRAVFDAASKRLRDRLIAATDRYIRARLSCGFPRDPENWRLKTTEEKSAHYKAKGWGDFT